MKKFLVFWKDGLSVDETKFSVLIILTIIYAIFMIIMYCIKEDVSSNLVLVFQTLVAAIAGINIAEAIGSKFGNNSGL